MNLADNILSNLPRGELPGSSITAHKLRRAIMFQIDAGSSPNPYCDGLTRRSFVQLGVAGMASTGLADVMRAKAMSAESRGKKDTSAILIW